MANKQYQAMIELKELIELGKLLDFKFEFDNPHIRKNFCEKVEEQICHKINYIVDEECLNGLQEKECTCPAKKKSSSEQFLEELRNS